MKNRYTLLYEDDINNKVIIFNYSQTENDFYLSNEKTICDKDSYYEGYLNKKSFKTPRTTLVNIDRITTLFMDANQFSAYLENEIDLDSFNPDNLKIIYKQNREIQSIKPLFNNLYLREKTFEVNNSSLSTGDKDVYDISLKLLSRNSGFREYVLNNYSDSDFKDEDVIKNLEKYDRTAKLYPSAILTQLRCIDVDMNISTFVVKRLSSYKNFREITLLNEQYEKSIIKENPKVMKKTK